MNKINPAVKLTREQAMERLDKANAVRVKRARLRLKVRSGKRTLASVIEHPPDYVETIRVKSLLTWDRWIGPKRVEAILIDQGIGPKRRLQSLSKDHRERLASTLRSKEYMEFMPPPRGRGRMLGHGK